MAALLPSAEVFIIIVRGLKSEKVTVEQELAIAHELGHLHLTLRGFPREKRIGNTSNKKQEAYVYFFGPLLEIMEHAVFYPWLKSKYEFDLYKVGNTRLATNFKEKILPGQSKNRYSEPAVMVHYIKWMTECDNKYWQERFYKVYSKNFNGYVEVLNNCVSIIKELTNGSPHPDSFIKKYRAVVDNIIPKLIIIEKESYPDFLCDHE